MVWLPDGGKMDMFRRCDITPACDRQSDGQTSCGSTDRVMYTHGRSGLCSVAEDQSQCSRKTESFVGFD